MEVRARCLARRTHQTQVTTSVDVLAHPDVDPAEMGVEGTDAAPVSDDAALTNLGRTSGKSPVNLIGIGLLRLPS